MELTIKTVKVNDAGEIDEQEIKLTTLPITLKLRDQLDKSTARYVAASEAYSKLKETDPDAHTAQLADISARTYRYSIEQLKIITNVRALSGEARELFEADHMSEDSPWFEIVELPSVGAALAKFRGVS